LRACQGVSDGAVVVRRNAAGVPRAIAAHVELQPETRGLLPRHVRAMLAQLLPKYTMPATIHLIDALPRLPNLKIDRVRLAAVDAEQASRPVEPDRDALVAAVARIFEDELEVGGATADDNVFSLGGDSLQAITIAVALEKQFGFRLPVDDEPVTIGELAARIAASQAGESAADADA
jgi:acyl carrier protein